MRQYERVESSRGEDFTYKDLKKVYTIVIMENSSREFKKLLKYIPESVNPKGENMLKIE